MDDVVVPWAFRGTRSLTHSLSHSLTHSITHSILINLFIKVRLNTLLLSPYLVLLLFQVPFTHIFGIFQRVLVRRTFFPNTKDQPAEDGFCINGNILNDTDNVICKKSIWNCLKDVEIIERGSLLYIWMNCTHLFPILLDMERMRPTGVWKSYRSLTMGFRSANKPKNLSCKKRSSNCEATLTFT